MDGIKEHIAFSFSGYGTYYIIIIDLGLLESIPLVSFLYSRVLRTTIGSLASAAGHRLGDCSWQQHMYAWQQPANEKCIVDNDNHLVDGVVWLDEADDE